ncbi:hypothetical protein AGMMS49525_02660 [Bacteroidia bacterium]|nr:hypothetical protein AGMMS49525_02660 [Bacteroidia bacterium]
MKYLLFIPSIMNGDWTHFDNLVIVLVVLYSCVLAATLIDLFFGVRRAKKLGLVRTSYGYRRTITKLTGYFGLMMLLSIADVVASIVFKMPYFTVIGAIGIIFVEAKSVFENIKETDTYIDEVPKALLQMFKNKGDIEAIIKYFNENAITINKNSNENQ